MEKEKELIRKGNDPLSLWEAWEKEMLLCGKWLEQHRTNLILFLLALAAALLVFFFVQYLLKKLLLPFLKQKNKLIGEIGEALVLPFSFLILLCGIAGSCELLSLPEGADLYLNKILYALFALVLLNGALRIIHELNNIFEEKLKRTNPRSYNMNKLLLDLTRSILKLAIWLFGTIFILQDIFGLHVTALMASAGILGLGIAFAAQNTIGNLFGAFSILGSKLFRVGDWIKTGNTEGVVEQIGFRSIRIRAFEGRLIDIPNRLVADSQLENYSNREYWREHFVFSLTYQTSMEDMEKALQILDGIGKEMQDVIKEDKNPAFTFLNCSASSLDLDGYVWFKEMDWYEMRKARERFNKEVMKRFTKEGLEFAYPTQTIFLKKE